MIEVTHRAPLSGHQHARSRVLSDDAVRSIAQDSEGNIWAGTRGAGLNRLQLRKLTTQKFFDGATEVQPVSLAETSDGSFWVGTIGHGLHRFQGKLHEVLLRNELLPENLQVSAMLAARDGSLWVIGGSTLFHWTNGILNSICQVAGVQTICEDKDPRPLSLDSCVRFFARPAETKIW
jgi:ligand-binding sensor domain-containing protein